MCFLHVESGRFHSPECSFNLPSQPVHLIGEGGLYRCYQDEQSVSVTSGASYGIYPYTHIFTDYVCRGQNHALPERKRRKDGLEFAHFVLGSVTHIIILPEPQAIRNIPLPKPFYEIAVAKLAVGDKALDAP